jgi:hypothetical protein
LSLKKQIELEWLKNNCMHSKYPIGSRIPHNLPDPDFRFSSATKHIARTIEKKKNETNKQKPWRKEKIKNHTWPQTLPQISSDFLLQ